VEEGINKSKISAAKSQRPRCSLLAESM